MKRRVALSIVVVAAVALLIGLRSQGGGGDDSERAGGPAEARPADAPSRVTGDDPRARWVAGEGHGKKPGRNQRWQLRMEQLDARARAELGVDADTAATLMTLQTDLRAFKHGIRRGIDGGMPHDEAAEQIRRRQTEFRIAVGKLLGRERAQTYLRIHAEIRAGDEGRHNG